jgi:hypothetical protein
MGDADRYAVVGVLDMHERAEEATHTAIHGS